MPNPIQTYLRESLQELRRVTWPTKNQAIRLTIIVLIFCAAVVAFIAAVDFLFNLGYTSLLTISK